MLIIKSTLVLMITNVLINEVVSDQLVMTYSGPIKGLTVPVLDSEVEAFLGIPFAEPPVGELRFRRPVPIRQWSEIYNATEKPPPCYQNASAQLYYMPNTENMTEDCLYLNVWVPKSVENETKLKPMLIWIHGGAFNLGSSEMDIYDGAVLAQYGDVIVASMNYRVGFFGFFTAFIEGANGNMGAYDQVMALRWLNDNAEVFGADRDMITLIGESAGAISVAGHLISPMTRNLFRRAILQSGAPIHPMSFEALKTQMKVSNSLAKITGCATHQINITTDPERVVRCLKRLPPHAISTAEGLMMKSNPLTVFPVYGDEYLPDEATKLVKSQRLKDTEILIGVTKDEGSFFLSAILPEYFGTYGHNGIETVSRSLAHSLIKGIFKATQQNNTKEIADYYIKKVKNMNTVTLREAIYQALGDFLITCNTLFFADFFSLYRDSTYFYKFSHRPAVTFTADWQGSTHFDEVQYVFGVPLRKEVNYTNEEQMITRRLMDRWLTFAKTGNPNIPRALKWPPYSHRYPVYMDIDVEETVKLRPAEDRCEFWRDRFRAQIGHPNYADSLKVDYNDDSDSSTSTVHPNSITLLGLFVAIIYLCKT